MLLGMFTRRVVHVLESVLSPLTLPKQLFQNATFYAMTGGVYFRCQSEVDVRPNLVSGVVISGRENPGVDELLFSW
jgi:hypothetical protein